jgi:uncharacterized membrane protein
VFAIALTLLVIDIRLPDMDAVRSSRDLWIALRGLGPAVFAFLLSFVVVFISWANHHNAMKLVDRSSSSFVYANGFLLLTIVFVPFPTSLLGASIATDHATPAVVLYDSVLALQALAWALVTKSALDNHLLRSAQARSVARDNRRHALLAIAMYSLLAIAALWLPVTVAVITSASWIVWLLNGIRMKASD